MPKYLSSDNDPLYRFHQWQANLRILEVTEIKSVPYVPPTNRKSPLDSLATTLSRPLPDAGGRLIDQRLALLRYSVDLGGTPRNLSLVPNRNALPRSDRFPTTRCVPKVRLSDSAHSRKADKIGPRNNSPDTGGEKQVS